MSNDFFGWDVEMAGLERYKDLRRAAEQERLAGQVRQANRRPAGRALARLGRWMMAAGARLSAAGQNAQQELGYADGWRAEYRPALDGHNRK